MTDQHTAARATRVLQVLGSSAGGVARHVGQISAALSALPTPVPTETPTSTPAVHPGTSPDAPTTSGVEVLVAGPESVRTLAASGPRVGFVAVEIADRPRPRDIGAVRALRSLAAGSDVMHAHGLRAGALAVLAGRSLSRRRRPRIVVTLHNLPVGSRKVRAVSAVLETVVGRGADDVLGVSEDLVTLARRRGARHARRALVPAPPAPSGTSATDVAAVRVGLGLTADERLLVTVGRLAPQKGLDTLCETASQLLLAEPGLRFVWVVAGDGPLAETLRADIDRRGVPVRPLGARSDAMDLMAAADVVVSTAVWEGQPLGIQEALRAGAAIVATDAGGTREVTADAAALVPVGDATALAAEIIALLSDQERLAARRQQAVRRAGELPSIDDAVSSLSHIYRLASDSPPQVFD